MWLSLNGNDGIVYGDAYVGGITLSRALRDNRTPVVKYTNPELFAVSQRSTYIEEFEFKMNGGDLVPVSNRPPVVAGLQVYLSGENLKGNRWEDLSGNNYHATQIPNSTPVSPYQVNNYNGKNFTVARFYVSSGMILPDNFSVNQPFTIIIVDRYYGNVQGRTLQSRDCNWLLGKWGGNNGCYMEGWIGKTPAKVNEFSLSTATLAGTTPQWYLNGNFNNNSGGSAAPGRLGLCLGGKGGEPSEADIACVLIYNRVLSDSERQQVEKWLCDRYGILTPNSAATIGSPISNINELFKFSYWGKTSRSAEEKIAISAVADDFKDLGKGWYRAQCRFTVPDGVALVRSFEISNVKGNWSSLEIRKHRIRLVSDAITEARYSDVINLATLADRQAALSGSLSQIEQKEQQEAELLAKKNKIEEVLAFLSLSKEEQQQAINAKQSAIDQQQKVVDAATAAVNDWQLELQRSDLQVTLYEYSNFQGESIKFGIGVFGMPAGWNDRLSSARIPQGLYLTVYEVGIGQGQGGTAWEDWASLGIKNNTTSAIRVETRGGNTDKSLIQTNLNTKNDELTRAQALLTRLQNELKLLTSQLQTKGELERQLPDIKNQLAPIQTELSTLNTNFINAVKTTQQTAQTMPQLARDAKGLVTQGALLGFVRPASRLNAIETCEGNVQLCYFDDKGQMRQTNYDATSDSLNPTFEEWIPDSLRTCLNLNNSKSVVKLNQTLYLGEYSTIEAWFAYPFNERLQWRILATSEDDTQRIVVYNDKQLGIRINDYFHDCGYNLEQLSRGWHHLAICTRDKASFFYIDGKKVGETPVKSTLAFDSENDYVSLPTMRLDFSQGFTVEAWVLYNDFTGWLRIIDLATGSILNKIYFDNPDTTKKLRLSVKNGDTVKTLESEEILEVGKWMHLAASIDTDGKVTLYKNGQVVASKKGILPSNAAVDWTQNFIGKSKGQPDSIYNGQITEVRLWNIARTQSEIQANFGKILTANEFGLVGYWQFAKGEVKDSSAKQYNGTVQGKPKAEQVLAAIPGNIRAIGNFYQQPIVEISTTSVALQTAAIALNGQTDYISIPDSTSLQITAYTAEIWIKPNGVPADEWSGILGKPGRNFNIWLNKAGYIQHQFHVGTNIYAGAPNTPNGSIKWDVWNHIAITNDGTTAKTYINGQLMAQGATGGTLVVDKTTLYMGRNLDGNNSHYFKGQIAEARVWNKACTQAEIQANMGRTLTGSETNLVGYWRFAGGQAKDSSPNGNNGTVNGTPQVIPINFSSVTPANSALSFDGVDDYISLPAMNVDYSQGFSLEVWVNYRSFKNWTRIIDFGSGAGQDNIVRTYA